MTIPADPADPAETETRRGDPREGRTWPTYLFGGRLRTSTLGLIVAFMAIWWLYDTYQPTPPPPGQVPAAEIVPPGFVPDPSYTWVPRSEVQRYTPTTATPTSTTPPSTTSTSEAAPTSPNTPPTEGTSPPSTSGESATLTPPTTPPSATTLVPSESLASPSATAPVKSTPSRTAVLPPLTHPTAMPSPLTPSAPKP